jgi:hypothetical protein
MGFMELSYDGRRDALQPAWSAYQAARYELGQMELMHALATLREELPGAAWVTVALSDDAGCDGARVSVVRVRDAAGAVLFDCDGDELDGATVEDYLTGAYEKEALRFSDMPEVLLGVPTAAA